METVLSASGSIAIVVADSSQVSAARLAAQRLARELEFGETRAGRLAIVVTEAVTNMLKHAGGGTLAARAVARGGSLGVEVLAIDRGPGMAHFEDSARDGASTTATAGTGLGAMRRQSDEFEVYTHAGGGTIVRMVVWGTPPPPTVEEYDVGAIVVPKAGETVSGDAWALEVRDHGATLLVADGLGHGPDASRAAQTAVEVLRRDPDHDAIRLLDTAHGRLRATRGAAVAVIRHDRSKAELAFAGVGNIAACVWDGATRRAMVSHNGIVGHNVHKSQEFRYPWPRGLLLVAHSDGLESQWSLAGFPGIADHHPSVIAALLYREHTRKRDDVVVVVVRASH
jgi:anti-sigma regulatory factor (Ser/Thr protein kinase)